MYKRQAEDFTRIVFNMKQELILLRTSTDLNAMMMTTSSATTATDANADLELDVYKRQPLCYGFSRFI